MERTKMATESQPLDVMQRERIRKQTIEDQNERCLAIPMSVWMRFRGHQWCLNNEP